MKELIVGTKNTEISDEYKELIRKGRDFLYKKNYEKATWAFELALTEDDNYYEAYHYLGDTYRDQGDFEKALENYNKANSFTYSHVDLHMSRGVIHFQQENYNLAIDDFQFYASCNPSDIDALKYLMFCYAELDVWDYVEDTLKKIKKRLYN